MLILTRKPGESVYIGDDIKITIVELKGHQIRVGIDAPKDFRIYREEIYLQILEENRKAAESPVGTDMGSLEGLSQAWGGSSGEGDSQDKPRSFDLGVKGILPKPVSLGLGTRKSVSTGAVDSDLVVRRKRGKKTDE